MAIKLTDSHATCARSPASTLRIWCLNLIEKGLSRFITVFYGNDADQVGLCAPGGFDEHIVRMYNAIFVFASADDRVLETWIKYNLLPRLVLPRPGNCPPLCRDEDNPDYITCTPTPPS